MANKPPTRDILRIIWTNFINSFRPRQIRGTYVGDDYFGNKYYEIPANPAVGKSKASRWFVPTDKEDFHGHELTAEWTAWLRGRRREPPTQEELMHNLQIMEMKKQNAAKLEALYGGAKKKQTHMLPAKQEEQEGDTIGTFPKYDEYELTPGDLPPKKKD